MSRIPRSTAFLLPLLALAIMAAGIAWWNPARTYSSGVGSGSYVFDADGKPCVAIVNVHIEKERRLSGEVLTRARLEGAMAVIILEDLKSKDWLEEIHQMSTSGEWTTSKGTINPQNIALVDRDGGTTYLGPADHAAEVVISGDWPPEECAKLLACRVLNRDSQAYKELLGNFKTGGPVK